MQQRFLALIDDAPADTETPPQRPSCRAECDPSGAGPWVQRPCVFVSCRHHLLSDLDVDSIEDGMDKLVHSANAGRIRPSCVLDLADQLGEMTLDEMAKVLSADPDEIADTIDEVLSRESVRESLYEHALESPACSLDTDQIELLVASVEHYGVEATAERMGIPARVVRSHHERYLTRQRIKEGQEPDGWTPTLEEAGLDDLLFEDFENA